MVNTFIPFSSFNKVASVLDIQRLRKQIVEAYQILDYLYIADVLMKYYGLPQIKTYKSTMEKTSPINQASYYAEMCARYRNYVQTVRDNNTDFLITDIYSGQPQVFLLSAENEDTPEKYYRPAPSDEIYELGDTKYIELTPGKKPKYWKTPNTTSDLPKNSTKARSWYGIPNRYVLEPDQKIVRHDNPHMNHPVILMWLGCKKSLLYYIRCMQDEYNTRGFSDVWTPYSEFPIVKCPKPWWCHGYNIIMATHQIRLLQKTTDSENPKIMEAHKLYKKAFQEYDSNTMSTSDYYWPGGKVEDTIDGVFDGVVCILTTLPSEMLSHMTEKKHHVYHR